MEIKAFATIVLAVAFAVFLGYKRLASSKGGEPAEDEMSKKVMQKSAAWFYYISLYMCVAIIYISDKVSLRTVELISVGIIGMAITFAICWLVLNFRSIRNA